jgi:hypothetical protein
MNKAAEIRRLYYSATAATVASDLTRAIELLKSMETQEERERVAVYMDGLAQMHREWAPAKQDRARPGTRTPRPPARDKRRGSG